MNHILESKNVQLEVKGKLPQWLKGTLVRNGPVRVTVEGVTNSHWFDGLAELHAFKIDNGKVFYSNRFLRTEAYDAVFNKENLKYVGFACDPCYSLFRRLAILFFKPSQHVLHNANINVAKFAEEYAALFEIPLPVRFDLETLETLGVVDYNDNLLKEGCWESAHPHTGKELVNYLIEYGQKSHYVIYAIAQGSTKRKPLARIPVKKPSYMHSFSLTDRYVILTEYPFVVNPLKMLLRNKPFIENYEWKPELGTTISVISRQTGNILQQFKISPFFSFHHINAFEENDTIILDLVTYPDASIIKGLAGHLLNLTNENNFPIQLKRFRISKEGVSTELLIEQPLELPRINPDYDGQNYRYAYLADPRQPSEPNDQRVICKFDLLTKQKKEWHEKHCYPGEPVFFATPKSKKEDDGILMTVVLDEANDRSFLLILDGESFEEISRIYTPNKVPQGLHGQFFS